MRNDRIIPTRSQPVGVRIDLSTDLWGIYASIGFDGRAANPAVLRQEATLLGGLSAFRHNDAAVGTLSHPPRKLISS